MKKATIYLLLMLLLAAACTSPQASEETAKTPLFNDSTSVFFDEAMKPFYHGVASGDPLADAVVIWTRVTPDFAEPQQVKWMVASDEAFAEVVKEGTTEALPENDFTVKIDVTGLAPATTYFYKFEHEGAPSVTGRTRTAPGAGAEALKFAFVSCSNYEAGLYNAFARIADRADLDAVVHLGDYIYEYGPGVYGDSAVQRFHLPKKEIIELQDYRTRYAQYRLDPDFRRAHQVHPFIAIWDDHEIANNSYKTGAQNHQPGEEGDYEARKAAARKAYFEWLPVRETTEQRLYRHISYGDLADLILLDERLEGRAKQAESVEELLADSTRTMLGQEQLSWFTENLAASQATWKLIGNQVIFADLDVSPVYNVPVNMDAWDGYPAEKQRIINFIDKNAVENVVFLTGDTHSSWAFEIARDNAAYKAGTDTETVAVEFGTPSITSSNSNERYPDYSVKVAESVVASAQFNPHLKYVNLRDHGYLLLSVTPQQATAEWYYVPTLKQKTTEETLAKRITVQAGQEKLVQ